MSRFRVTDKSTGETKWMTEDELASLPARRERRTSRHRFPPIPDEVDRNVAIKLIREALKKRSGKSWSVTGGTGTSWGWIEVNAPPARRNYDTEGNPGGHYASPRERKELAELLGLDRVHTGGVSIAASTNHRKEYIMRARGQEPTVRGEQYWD